MLEQLLEYTFKVSAALALINMAPVIYLDGQAALDVLVAYLGDALDHSLCSYVVLGNVARSRPFCRDSVPYMRRQLGEDLHHVD